MKKLVMLVLFTVMAVALAACGGSGGAAPANGEGTASQTSQPEQTSQPQQSSQPSPQAQATEELTFKHQLGEAKVKKNPQKVVVFDYGVLDSLDKLGVAITGVPQGNIPAYLSKYKDAKYVNVGSLQEPDFEKISEISPDVIFISGRQSKAYEELSKIAPTMYMAVDTKNYMDSFTQNMKTLGQIFGKEAAVEQELKAINENIDKVKQKASNGQSALIVLSNGGKVSAYGPGSRFGIIHDVLGVKPVDENIEVSTHGQTISFEFIAEKNPDYLFVVDRDAVVTGTAGQAPAQQVIENDLVKNTNAYKNGNIVYLDPSYWYLSGGGLVSVSSMIQEVDKGLK